MKKKLYTTHTEEITISEENTGWVIASAKLCRNRLTKIIVYKRNFVGPLVKEILKLHFFTLNELKEFLNALQELVILLEKPECGK